MADTIPVATPILATTGTVLESIDIAGYGTGDLAFVESLQAYYSLSPTSTAAPDGLNTLYTRNSNPVFGAAAGAASRWIFFAPLGTGAGINFPTMPALFLSPTAGNDANDGLTAATPIRSQLGINRLVGLLPTFENDFTLNMIGPGPFSDPLILTWAVGPAVVQIVGEETLFASPPALTVVQPRAPAGNVRGTVTAGAFNWVPSEGKIVHIVSSANPANVGAHSNVIADIGGGQAEMATWIFFDPLTMSIPVEITPLVGDVVEVVNSFVITGDIDINVIGPWTDVPGIYKFFFRRFDIDSAESSSLKSNGLASATVSCVLHSLLFTVNFDNINMNSIATDGDLRMNTTIATGPFPKIGNSLYGGSSKSITFIVSPAIVNIKMGYISKGATIGIAVGGGGAFVELTDAGLYDWTGFGVYVLAGSSAQVAGPNALWGTTLSLGTPVVAVSGGGQLIKDSGTWVLDVPAVGGAAVAFASLGNNGTTYSSVSPFDQTTFTFTAPIPLTQTNLDTPSPPGFGGSVIDQRTGARFLST